MKATILVLETPVKAGGDWITSFRGAVRFTGGEVAGTVSLTGHHVTMEGARESARRFAEECGWEVES